MTDLEILQLVHQMRSAQKAYFRTRDKAVMVQSKTLEKRVDDALFIYFAQLSEKKANEI